MEMQNVTLRLPKDIVQQMRHMAVEKGISFSKLAQSYLVNMLKHEPEYERLRRQFNSSLNKGFDLGTKGKRTWTREELHER